MMLPNGSNADSSYGTVVDPSANGNRNRRDDSKPSCGSTSRDSNEKLLELIKNKTLVLIGLFLFMSATVAVCNGRKSASPSVLLRSPLQNTDTTTLYGTKHGTSTAAIVDGFLTSDIGQILRWYCAPDSWNPIEGRREGRGGSWSVDDASKSLIMAPPAKKDNWRKTYYEPVLIKDDGPFLYATLTDDKYYTVETTLQLTAVRQFDQAGIMIRLGPEHWLKTGIEVVDNRPRLSCVVTNVFSDWSTQAWSNYTVDQGDESLKGSGATVVTVHCQIRVHCRGDSFVVEAKMPTPSGSFEWQFIRIAHLAKSSGGFSSFAKQDPTLEDGAPTDGTLWAGVFAASPEDQQGGYVTFTSFTIQVGSHFEHNADGNQDTR
ncbi:Protein of unknown function (DUF1349) [Seminavis robusta]|uniref:Lectin n=1 Tax=Seminavis robusta TaxID=568900 RepID=A0A9N8D7C4_9STRA|nr:Protein of unknown function (DUF1349) [Seminavis robusta]|eukprot:Sro6_g004920.1 Protein of unknown function (DUF1349) (375) ;mRNA; f:49795-50919